MRALKDSLATEQPQQWLRQFHSYDNITAMSDSLQLALVENTLNFAEFTTMLTRISSMHNDRPLGVKKHYSDEDVYVAVTPNQMLLGKSSASPDFSPRYTLQDDKYTERLAYVEEVERAWWGIWYKQVFANLLPYHDEKASKVHENLKVDDICHVFYDSKYGKGTYRIGIITDVFPDEHGIVRDVTVAMRPRDSREKTLPYKPYKREELEHLTTTVQRVAKLEVEE